jgi:MFS transporter, DHA2 family, multidrug resistance protein
MATAAKQAIEAISNLVQQQATVMAINDCFYLLGILMLLSGIALLFMKRAKVGSKMAQ